MSHYFYIQHPTKGRMLYEPFDYETYLNSNTRHGIDKSSVEWLEKWFSEWKGYSQQVVFEANVLVVDPHNVMFSTYQPKVFELLDKQLDNYLMQVMKRLLNRLRLQPLLFDRSH